MPSAGIDGPELALVPASLKQPVQGVSTVPEEELDGKEIADLWISDRAALGACRRRHGALVGAVDELEKQVKPPG